MNTIVRKINHAFKYLIHDREQLINSLLSSFFTWLPDKLYLRLKFRFSLGYWPNFKNPQSFNEKLNWLKLYNRKPEYTQMVDKFAMKEFVAKKIGKEYVLPVLGVWNTPDEIEWEKLPNQFVLKTTHGGGNNGVVICQNLDTFDKMKAIKRLCMSLKQDIYKSLKEWPYKNVPRRIIAEHYIEEKENKGNLQDYKFFCFNGKVRFFKIDFDRSTNHHANYFDLKGNLLPFGEVACAPIPEKNLKMPSQLDTMVELTEKLSKEKPFLRVDFYESNNNVYVGELTFYPASGLGKWTDKKWDFTLGSYLNLPSQ